MSPLWLLLLHSPCEGVLVEGTGDWVEALSAEVQRLGLASRGDCSRMWAKVTGEGDSRQLQLEVDGRIGTWPVDDVNVAAVLIESWLHEERLGFVPTPPEGPEPGMARLASSFRPSEDLVASTIELPSHPSKSPEVTLGVQADGGLWQDQSLMGGVSIEFAGDWLGFPTFALVRGYLGTPLRETALQTYTDRKGVDVFIGGRLPIHLGAWSISPGIFAGLGALESSRSTFGRDACTQNCPPVISDGLAVWTLGPRLGIELGTALELGVLSPTVTFRGTYNPVAAGDAILPSYATDLPPAEKAILALAPEPSVAFWVSIGTEVAL